MTIRAQQRLGFLRRAAHILTPAGRTTAYKAFVRPVMEYARLVWMGAPASHIQRLDNVQRRALRIIGPGAILPSLAVRRTVAALSCMYKLHFITGPPQLHAVLPPHRHRIAFLQPTPEPGTSTIMPPATPINCQTRSLSQLHPS